MSLWKEYLQPKTVQAAVEALASAPSPAIPIAGGTDLMLDLQQGHHTPVHTLVDLTGIAEMGALEIRGAQLFIGAGVPVRPVSLGSRFFPRERGIDTAERDRRPAAPSMVAARRPSSTPCASSGPSSDRYRWACSRW